MLEEPANVNRPSLVHRGPGFPDQPNEADDQGEAAKDDGDDNEAGVQRGKERVGRVGVLGRHFAGGLEEMLGELGAVSNQTVPDLQVQRMADWRGK